MGQKETERLRERSYPFRNVNQAIQVEIGAAERRWLNPFTLKRGKIPVMLIYELFYLMDGNAYLKTRGKYWYVGLTDGILVPSGATDDPFTASSAHDIRMISVGQRERNMGGREERWREI